MLVSSALAERLVRHEILISLFLIITSPITTTLLMQAALHRDAWKTGLELVADPRHVARGRALPADNLVFK
ncbi:MAG: hypothetical protein EPN46_03830 [Candidimonas sp.]|nr:MAG: hypothetical protein EPN77_16445 [Candidimonas sp.]TAM24204.1 MAG: hypothetical protein EPN62_07515 [Candidimonas sp.]TAM79338.1 MAG: hypothetical protein EPN46_03830 [Candidimonas sp.]